MDSRGYGVKNIRFCKENYKWFCVNNSVGGFGIGYSLSDTWVIYKKWIPFFVKYVCEFDTKDDAVNFIESQRTK